MFVQLVSINFQVDGKKNSLFSKYLACYCNKKKGSGLIIDFLSYMLRNESAETQNKRGFVRTGKQTSKEH